MTDFRHAQSALIRRCFSAHQLVFEMHLNHFAHQAVGCSANRGDLLQDSQAGFT
ncbi:Uncharacterised protein [Kluyvera cryocrescens]|uniref:Uncharacterized protein n=1 Tax=Kluyvera cryocrescens TaxID=580 RepID=A0A485CPP4_KLUCR|nr:Uncharacterised protein [Kluyvera cryocrescens]